MNFKLLQTYKVTDWFTGGTQTYKVTSVNERQVTFKVISNELDGISDRTETYDILKDKNGFNYVTLYEYKGEENRIYADRKIYRICNTIGYPIGHDDFETFEEALEYGKKNLDLFTIKNMETDEIEYSNFLDY
jgi:hypothetical protein